MMIQATIIKCFWHAGFLPELIAGTEKEFPIGVEDISLDEELNSLPEFFRSQLPNVEPIRNFDDILEVHEDVPDTAEVQEKVITNDKSKETSSDKEEEAAVSLSEKPPTHQRALECIKELEHYAFSHGQPRIIEVLFGLERDIERQ